MAKNKFIVMIVIGLCLLSSCSIRLSNPKIGSGYGVFIGLEGDDVIASSEGFDLVILDAQTMSKEEIKRMKDRGQSVYSYLNVGSLETFRPYYEKFQFLTLKPYLDWEEEFWVDLGNLEWQIFIKEILILELLEKGIDGFWVDNVDVYSHFPSEETYRGLEEILTYLMSFNKAVILNGGDDFVKAYLLINNNVDEILTGVNQETVFTKINFENGNFTTQTSNEQNYYLKYLDLISNYQKDIYLLEYTNDETVILKIAQYATEKGWEYYVSHSIELD